MKNKKYLLLDIFNNHIKGWTYSFLLIPYDNYDNCQNMLIILNDAIGKKQWFEILPVFYEKKFKSGLNFSCFKRLAVRP